MYANYEFSIPDLCTSGDVHLVDGYTPTEGRLEMCINGSWTSFYGYYSNWDTDAANVACRQMFGKTACKSTVDWIYE